MLALTRPRSLFGEMLRQWRLAKPLSQLELAMRAGTSPRHLSFVETGRSRPGRELVERLVDVLDVPDAARAEWLVAAGFPPAQSTHGWAPGLLVRQLALPALVVGESLEVLASNDPARVLLPGIDQASTLLDAFASAAIRRRLRDADDVIAGWRARLVRSTDTVRIVMQVATGQLELRSTSTPLSDGSWLEILSGANPQSEALLFDLTAR